MIMIPWDKELFDKYAAIREQLLQLWRAGSVQEAIELGEQWWRELPEMEGSTEPQTSLIIARYAAKAGDTAQARVWLDRAKVAYEVERSHDVIRSLVGFVEGVVLFHEGNLDRAFDYFKAAYDYKGKRAFSLPRDQEYWDFFSGRAGLKKRRKVRTKDLEKLANEGDRLQAGGDPLGAVEVWEQAVELLGPEPVEHPMSMWFYASMGDALFEAGKYREAVDVLGDALRSGGTDNCFVWLRRGQSLAELGDVDSAVESLISGYMLEGDELFEDEDPKYRQLLVDRDMIRD